MAFKSRKEMQKHMTLHLHFKDSAPNMAEKENKLRKDIHFFKSLRSCLIKNHLESENSTACAEYLTLVDLADWDASIRIEYTLTKEVLRLNKHAAFTLYFKQSIINDILQKSFTNETEDVFLSSHFSENEENSELYKRKVTSVTSFMLICNCVVSSLTFRQTQKT